MTDQVKPLPDPDSPEMEQLRKETEAAKQAAAAGVPAVAEPKKFTLASGEKKYEATAAELRELSFDQLQQLGLDITTADEAIGSDQYGPILEDKQALVGKPCMFVHWEFYPGDFGEFVSAWVITMENGQEARYIVNDGSSGIYAQLKGLTTNKGVDSMMFAKHGLRVSTYDKEMPNGTVLKDCKTYYIDTKL